MTHTFVSWQKHFIKNKKLRLTKGSKVVIGQLAAAGEGLLF